MAAHGADLRQGHHRRHHRGPAPRGVHPQEPAADRRPRRQRHVRHGDGRAHRLQHGLRIDAAEQPASLSVDELALPGRHHRRLAPRRELHRRSRATVRDPRAARRCAHAARERRHQPARVLRVRALQRRGDDRPGNPRAAEGLGRRRRRRHGRHRLSEHVEGDAAEPAERQGRDARHAGLLEHRRPELRLDADARRQRHERVRHGHARQERREEDRR